MLETLLNDGEYFLIDPATGELSFVTIPNFETPLDGNSDNIYELSVSVTVGANINSLSISIKHIPEDSLHDYKLHDK